VRHMIRCLAPCVAILVACVDAYPPPPETRTETVADTLHGVAFVDDYRWLEAQDAPETRTWIAAQNAYAERIVGESPLRDRFRDRLRELTDRPNVGNTTKAGDFEYFSMRRTGDEAPRIYRRPGPAAEDAEEPSPDGDYEVVLDPIDFDPDYRVVLSMGRFSPDEGFMMYSVRQGGADEVEVLIRDLEAGEDLPDRLPNALYGDIAWDEDSQGFTYVLRSREIGPRLRHHALGQDLSSDEELWGDAYDATTFIGTSEEADGRYRLYRAQHGWASNDWFIQDVGAGGPIRPMVEGVQAHFQVRFHKGRLYIRTDWEAPRYRVMVADPERPGSEYWSELLPESEDVLTAYSFIDGKIYATYLHDVADRVRVFEMDGTPVGEMDVPPASTVTLNGEGEGGLTLAARGYMRPSRTWTIDIETGVRELTDSQDVPFDTTGFVVTRTWYTSEDGTRAPMSVMHREGIELDGTHPTILNGYGGFNSAIRPGFSTTRAAWVEMGGIYAVATLRGGSEFGETWHRDGMLTNKPNVFADFIAAAEHLIAEGYTGPEHLGIAGGSNGGLLVASVMTKRPELFRAVLCTYPDLDMVRFFTFTETNNMPALLEYGDARIPEQFEVIRTYSPYQAVRDGVEYPAVMLATGDLDTRVPPLQARKLTARLQAATASGLPVILWYDEMGGHAAGRGRPTSLRIEDTARELTFLAQQLGLTLRE